MIAYQYERGRLAGLSRNDKNGTSGWTWQRYKTYYNAFGQSIKITVSQANDDMGFPYNTVGTELTLAEYTYAPNGGNLQKMTYGNGDFVEYTYDLLDRVIEEVYYNSSGTKTRSVTFVYDARGQLAKRYTKNASDTDTVTETHIFEYDSLGRLIRSSEFDGANNLIQRIEQLYDKANRLEKQSWVIDGDSYSESYTYNDPAVGADASVRPKDGSLASVTTATGDTENYGYDALKRLTRETVKDGEDTLFYTAYAYRDIVYETQTTGQVEYRNVRREDGSLISGFKYAYDAVGNITDIYESQLVGNNTERRILAHYEYDTLNQLTQEKIYNYAPTNKTATPTSTDTYVYTYDSAGNILKEEKNGTVVNAYTYSSGPWTDMLTRAGGMTISYDGAGNPLSYANGNNLYTFTWQDGRKLSEASVDGENIFALSFAYDADGIRTQKEVTPHGGTATVHSYVTQNGKVVRETIGTGATAKVLDFIYDNTGKPFALIYTNGTAIPVTYYYVLNLQGDVVALITADCTIVAQYTYNAWGKLLSVTDEDGEAITSASHIANLNPIRYRGYYYDTETGFYYLQSRYYDPANHRFINADCYTSTGQGFLGYNMFAYCGNQPINNLDESGDVYTSGQIHNFVVKRICKRNPNIVWQKTYMRYKKEYKNHTYGYCDLYCPDTGEIWEVKRFSTAYTCTNKYATEQLWNYITNGTFKDRETPQLRPGSNIPSEVFEVIDSDGEGKYVITYMYSGGGIINYDYYYVPSVEEITEAAWEAAIVTAYVVTVCLAASLVAPAFLLA